MAQSGNHFFYHSRFDSFGQILVQRVDVFSFDRDLRSVLKLHLIGQTDRQTDDSARSSGRTCADAALNTQVDISDADED